MDQLDGFPGKAVFQFGIVGLVGVGFHRMGQSIHACGGGGVGRKSHGQLRVQDRVFRRQEGIVDGGLPVGFGIGDDRRHGGLGAGSCRCRHSIKMRYRL